MLPKNNILQKILRRNQKANYNPGHNPGHNLVLPNFIFISLVLPSLILLSLALFASASIAENASISGPSAEWWKKIRSESKKKGVSEETLRRSLAAAEWPVADIIRRDRGQAEYVENFWLYFTRRVDATRIAEGKKNLREKKALFDRIEAKYQTPARYLVAFWGMETKYGSIMGDFNAIAATATLSLDKRRQNFFRRELIAALIMVEKGYIEPENMQSSWAGAMGHMQFIPSTALTYAVDGDKDKLIDLHNSVDDAMFSAANFLTRLGWRKKGLCGYEVTLPEQFDYNLSGYNKRKPLSFWEKRGVRTAHAPEKLIPSPGDKSATLLVPIGAEGPAFLVFSNFYRIMSWNRSITYALSVCHLANRIGGGKGIIAQVPESLGKPLSKEEVKIVQHFLRKSGFLKSPSDGVFGPKTRIALQKWQTRQKIIADGYLSRPVFEKITRKP